jgi:hypothetical protein
MRGAEQDSRELGALGRPGGPVSTQDEDGDAVDGARQRRAFHPARRGPQRRAEQIAGTGLVVSQNRHGQPDLQLSAHPVPPRRLPLRQPGQGPRAVAGRRGQVAFARVQLRAHDGQPSPHVVEAHAALGCRSLGSPEVRTGALQIARPQPGRGQHPVDIGQVAPGPQFLAERTRLLQGRDRRRVVPPELGQLGQLDQYGGRSP